jgi:chitodextrinase
LTVADARYFHDGYGMIQGDLIQVGSNSPARVTAVNYSTNTITVNRSISWNNGDGVSYEYIGFQPDIGAYEYGSSGTTPPPTAEETTPPSVPAGLTATAVTSSQISLSWIASTDNVGVTGYKVYKNGALIGTTTTASYLDTGLAASTSYIYNVAAYDAAGNVSAQSASLSATTLAAADTQAPTVPSNLLASAVSTSQINLSWTASTDNKGVSGYKVYRNGTQIATATTTSYSNTGLAGSTAYTYTMSAYDAAGNASGQSASVSATTQTPPDTQSPTVPANLLASAVSTSQINLSWTASTDNKGVSGYKVYRNGTQIATATTASYSDTGLAASTSYIYKVAAYDAAGNVSGQSIATSATTQAAADTQAPTVPTGLSATAKSASQINLSWTASTDNVGVKGYKIYRNGTQIATVTTTSYYNIGLAASTVYTYTVSAYDAAGNVSGQSATASAKTRRR